MKDYEDLNLKELKQNYDYGDRCLLDYLRQFIPEDPDDEINELYTEVSDYNEIYANGWTIEKLFEMGNEDKYWTTRAENFIKKYNISKDEYSEYSTFFDKYLMLRDTLLNDMGIDDSILDMEVDEIPEKWFITNEVLTSIDELDEENSFTVARVMNLCHCVELHYYDGEAIIEYGTKKGYYYWENNIEEAEWFNKSMSDCEVLDKLEQLFKEYFGEKEFVLEGSEYEVYDVLQDSR